MISRPFQDHSVQGAAIGLVPLLVSVWAGFSAGMARAEASWIFRPSYFSHAADNEERVAQFAPLPTPARPYDATYAQSGYRHSRTTIRGVAGADHLHLVETWGAGERIRPYGEWLRPFREGATPFGPWGSAWGAWTLPWSPWAGPSGVPQSWSGWQAPWPTVSPYRPPPGDP